MTWTETLDLPNTGDNHNGHGFTQDSALVTHGSQLLVENEMSGMEQHGQKQQQISHQEDVVNGWWWN